ncbi:hypothetical protein ACC691_40975, partial [Rhizobium johnstonii]|uniref:hypothetical protein n=1 Tax=Rhizobium johnstonii TaxID=3019933 RepID=UPI003F946967
MTQLVNSDLTRIEAFLRDARLDVLADALIDDVLLPLVGRLTGTARQRANAVLARWARDENAWLRRGARAAGIPK